MARWGPSIPATRSSFGGSRVGEVKSVGFAFNASSDALSTPVTISLYPTLFHVQGAAAPTNPAALRTLVSHLVDHGLRARLEREPPLIGAEHVVLDINPSAPPPTKTASGQPSIPTSSGGGVGSIMDKLNGLPIGQIAQNVLDLTHHADALVASPDLTNAVAQLDAAVKQAKGAAQQANDTMQSVGPKVTRLVETLDRTAHQLDRAAVSAQRTAASADRAVSSTTNQYGLQSTMREMTEAARSVRALANFLDRHPEALIQGRPGG